MLVDRLDYFVQEDGDAYAAGLIDGVIVVASEPLPIDDPLAIDALPDYVYGEDDGAWLERERQCGRAAIIVARLTFGA